MPKLGIKNWARGARPLAMVATLIAVWVGTSSAQSRMSDQDVGRLMKNLKQDAKEFRGSFKSSIGKSTIRKTTAEKDATALVEAFQKQTGTMLKHFQGEKKADTELLAVLASADQIDSLLQRVSLDPRTNADWRKVKSELDLMAKQFGIAPTGERR